MSILVLAQEMPRPTLRTVEQRKYRIAVFHNLNSGGARRAISDYMRSLAMDGHTFDVYDYSSSNIGVLPLDKYAEKMVHAEFSGDTECRLRMPFVSGYLKTARKLRNLRKLKRIGKHIAARIDNGGYDVAFINHCSVVQAPYLLRYLKTPSVFYSGDPPRGIYEPPIPRDYEHDKRPLILRMSDMWYRPARYLENYINSGLLKRIYEKNMAYVDVLMANSYYSYETFYKLHGIRAQVVHPGIDANEFRPLALKKKNMVLSVGGIEPIKGHDFAIESLATIDRKVRPELHIVGNRGYGIEKRYLTTLARNLSVGLTFEDDVSTKRLIELYNTAKITCCGAVLEPFGLTPLESMSCETPVVAVREGGFRESVAHGESGYLSDRDPERFGGFMRELLIDEELRENMGKHARQHVLKYWTLDRVKKQLLELFEIAIIRNEKATS